MRGFFLLAVVGAMVPFPGARCPAHQRHTPPPASSYSEADFLKNRVVLSTSLLPAIRALTISPAAALRAE